MQFTPREIAERNPTQPNPPADIAANLELTPSTLAERYPVSLETYRYLWNDLVPDIDKVGRIANHWHNIPAAIQADIIAAVRIINAEEASQ